MGDQGESNLATIPPFESINYFVADKGNIGDWYCAPLKYFPFKMKAFADIRNPAKPSSDDLPKNVIIGGGGLVAPFCLDFFTHLVSVRRATQFLIGWGLGFNIHYDTHSPRKVENLDPYMKILDNFDLIDLRDFGTKYRWVPCDSCLHSVFGKKYEVTNRIEIYEHKDVPLGINGFPVLRNSETNIIKVAEFLGAAETVVTNSYHGVYWATILGRRVVAIPFSSRFHNFKHMLTLSNSGNWKQSIDKTKTYPEALAECHHANISFFCDVSSALEHRI